MQKIKGLSYLKIFIILSALVADLIFCCGFCLHTIGENEKYDVKLLTSFITFFDKSNVDRCHNIRLAAQKIDGYALKCGEVFSFNKTVGPRTEQRGFRRAVIIENGEFVDGMGGGVCQVSTTLYNAALLSGCKIREYHPHSLAVSYVPPSRDAMVSGDFFDLRFENATDGTLYFCAVTGENFVKFKVYGRDSGVRYILSSAITGSIPAPEQTTSDPLSVRDGKDGIVSEGYVTVVKDGVERQTLLRRDKYAPRKKIVLASDLQPPTEQENDATYLPSYPQNVISTKRTK